MSKIKCHKCKEDKIISEFPKSRRNTTLGVQGVCKECKSKWMREDRMANPDRYKHQDLMQGYGISLEEYNVLLNKQEGKCAICGSEDPVRGKYLHVDHCHSTGEIRGLLCANCNTGIGKFKDDIKLLENASRYLSGGE